MARYVTTAPCPRPAAEGFAFMADVTRFAEWDPGVTRAVRVVGDGLSVGTAYDLTVRAGRAVLRYEVTAYEPPRRLVLVARTRWLTSVDEIRVAPTATGCDVTYDAQLTLNGALGAFDPLLQIAFRRLGDRAAGGLRQALAGLAAG